jgi:hypothetical protein
MTITVNGLGELKVLVGQHLGYSGWLQLDQDRINTFADATGDPRRGRRCPRWRRRTHRRRHRKRRLGQTRVRRPGRAALLRLTAVPGSPPPCGLACAAGG